MFSIINITQILFQQELLILGFFFANFHVIKMGQGIMLKDFDTGERITLKDFCY